MSFYLEGHKKFTLTGYEKSPAILLLFRNYRKKNLLILLFVKATPNY